MRTPMIDEHNLVFFSRSEGDALRGRGSPRNGASPGCSGSSPGHARSVIPRSRSDRAEDSGQERVGYTGDYDSWIASVTPSITAGQADFLTDIALEATRQSSAAFYCAECR